MLKVLEHDIWQFWSNKSKSSKHYQPLTDEPWHILFFVICVKWAFKLSFLKKVQTEHVLLHTPEHAHTGDIFQSSIESHLAWLRETWTQKQQHKEGEREKKISSGGSHNIVENKEHVWNENLKTIYTNKKECRRFLNCADSPGVSSHFLC